MFSVSATGTPSGNSSVRLPGSGISGTVPIDDLVVAAAHVDHGRGRRVVGEDPVGALERVDLDALDAAVGHALLRDLRGLDDADPEGAAAGRVERDHVGLVGAEDDEPVDAGRAARVGDLDRAELSSAIVTR